MNLVEQRNALVARLKAVAQTAQGRGFTPAEEADVKSMMTEVKSLDVKIAAQKASADMAGQVRDFLAGDGAPSGKRAKGRTVDDSWAKAMTAAVPQLSGATHGTKSLSIPSSSTFEVPAPGLSIAAPGIAFSTLLDVITIDDSLNAGAISYLRSVQRERASRVVAPGAVKPTKVAKLERVDAPALTIAVLLDKIARQDLDDYADLVRWLDFELKGDLAQTLDQQMLLGTGLKDLAATPPRPDDEFEGIFFTEGVQVQDFDQNASRSVRLAMAKVEQVGHANTAIALNPLDYAELELEIGGPGAYRGDRSPAGEEGPRTVWNTPVVSTPQMPRGLSVVGDFSTIGLWERNVAEVRIVETNEDDFKRNQFLARAELRAAFGVTVPIALTAVKLNATVKLPGQA